MAWKELDEAERETLIALYAACPTTVDDLPYTDEFERLYAEFIHRTGRVLSLHDFWKALASARKTGKLVRKER